MSKKNKSFNELETDLYNIYHQLTKNNRKIINNDKALQSKDLQKFAEKYPKAYIVSEQVNENSSKDEDFVIDAVTYPDFYVRKLTPVISITANEKIIVLSSSLEPPVLEGFDIPKITSYKNYMTGKNYIESLKRKSENMFFGFEDDYLFNNWISESYFAKEGNGWDSVYFCNKRKYLSMFACGKSLTNSNILVFDAHY
jgi:hypothetical protein